MLQVSTFGELCTVSLVVVIIASVHMQYFIGHAIAHHGIHPVLE